MLATLAVILWAYGMYALFSFLFHRQGGYVRSRSPWRKLSRFILVAGVTAGTGLIVWGCLYPDKHVQQLKLAGFLGTVYAKGWPDRVDPVKYPPVKTPNQGSSEQPGYALLHPETANSRMGPEKKLPKPRPNRATPTGQALGSRDKAGKNVVKVAKTTAPQAKKDKATTKSHNKKKNRSSAPRGRQADAG